MHKLLLKLCGNLAGKLCNSFTIAVTKFLKTAALEIGTKSVLPTVFWSKKVSINYCQEFNSSNVLFPTDAWLLQYFLLLVFLEGSTSSIYLSRIPHSIIPDSKSQFSTAFILCVVTSYILLSNSDGSNFVRSSMFDRLKPKIGC